MIYTIEGSEDGLIQATTSRRTAAAVVAEYLGDKNAEAVFGELQDAFTKSSQAVAIIESRRKCWDSCVVKLWD